MPPSDDLRLDQTDVILVLLAAETQDSQQRFRVNGITRLEKLVFLLEEETDFAKEVAEPFTFEPYHYGPYSREVYDAVDYLKSLRLLSERQMDVSTGVDLNEELGALDDDDLNGKAGYIERQLFLTEDGKAVAKLLSTRVSPDGKRVLTDLKRRYGRMPLKHLLRYVYSQYEPYTTKSRIRSSVG